MNTPNFAAEIATNSSLDTLPSPQTSELATDRATLHVRERGCYITELSLYSQKHGADVDVLYSDPGIDIPKLTASHPMSPVGPYDGIGGQHGFPRWADYKEFPQDDAENSKRTAFQAKRSDSGPALAKTFDLTDSALEVDTVINNPSGQKLETSAGEHLYFTLTDENFTGLTLNGVSLDELLGEGSVDAVREGTPLYWGEFEGEATLSFPAGHEVGLSASSDDTDANLGMLIWHRPGTESICFEPVLGFDPEKGGSGLAIAPYETVVLSTKIELL